MPAIIWRVLTKPAVEAPRPNTALRSSSAFWPCSINRRQRDMRTRRNASRLRLGRRRCWPACWSMCTSSIWRFLRAQKIDLSGRKSWCESHDPEFVAKAAEVEPRGSPAIVGLCMAPPGHTVVRSVDEKPSIQALERAQGYLKLPTGRAMTGQSHDYKRHGTTTLFAALEVATGKGTGRH